MSNVPIKYIDSLKHVYFLSELSDDDLLEIAVLCSECTCASGDFIGREGEVGDCCYIVLEGSFEIWRNYGQKNKQNLIGCHYAGHIIGEMSLLDDLPRSATVRAQTAGKVLRIDGDDFKALLARNNAVCRCILRSLSSIVRNTNDLYVSDISNRNVELESAYEELKRMQKRIVENERLSILGKFSSLILHDIRNPLSVLKSRIEMLALYHDDPQRFEKCIAAVNLEITRMEALAAEFLDYARGEVRLNMGICSVPMLLKRLQEAVSFNMMYDGIVFKVNSTFDKSIILDEERILRVLVNIVDNARKASLRDQTIELTVSESDHMVLFVLVDSGAGMTDEILSHIFEPFYSSSKNGVGLGLIVVKNVVEAHGGTVVVSSVQNKGTTVTLRLPLLV